MIDAVVRAVAQKFIDNNIIKTDDVDIYIYGLQMMISGIVKFIGFILIAWTLGWIPEALVFIITFSSIRVYAGGYHADTYIKCFLITATATFLSIFIVRTFFIDYMFPCTAILIILACSMIFKYAPVDTPNKRIAGDEIKVYRAKAIRNMLLEILLIVIVLLLAPQWMFFCNIAAMAMFFEGITLLPIFLDK
jgi:accessory gene regulator B